METTKLKLYFIIFSIIFIYFIGFFLISYFKFSSERFLNFIFKILLNGFYFVLIAYIFKSLNLADFNSLISIGLPTFIFSVILSLLFGLGKKKEEVNKNTGYEFRLEHNNGTNIYYNPFNGFLVYGGAEAGKTVSIGKPLLREYIRHNFAGFIYDAKENDYTKTALKLAEIYNYKYPIYNLDFVNIHKSFRTNPIDPKIVKSEAVMKDLATTFFEAYLSKDGRKDEWFGMGLSVFKGVALRFYMDYPQYCTLPHITNFLVRVDAERILEFIKGNEQAEAVASPVIQSMGSPKTFSSIMTTVGNYIGDFASDKNICYVLSGNDFSFDPLNPEEPKLICVSNHYLVRKTISPVVALLVNNIAKQFHLGNKIPFVYFLDEATTFKIPDFEGLPSEFRQYLCSVTLLTQSSAKIEAVYNSYDRSSLESNLSNQFYGWTGDTKAFDNYAKQFSKIIEKTRSVTSGTGRNGKSTTIGERKEDRYDGEFFGRLKPGEFVGKAKNSNVTKFHNRFKMYSEGSVEEIQTVRELTKEDIDKVYMNIINDVKSI